MKLGALSFWRGALLTSGAILLACPAFANQSDVDLSRLSLEQLAQVDIESVSRRAEPLSRAAAAAFVISAEDIRRSGATSLPEVLRLAPNLTVQRVNAADYAITARGVGGFEPGNKVLLLIDGRSVYSSLYSGVAWDTVGLMLEDIERIDVISGPGGTLYGANAVNAVIAVTTRNASETLGPALAVTVGEEDNVLAARHGWQSGDWSARVYARAFERDDGLLIGGGDDGDPFTGVRAGVRADWNSAANAVMAQASLLRFDRSLDDISGGDALVRWDRELGTGGQFSLQAYYDHSRRVEPGLVDDVDTYDISAIHAMAPRGRHSLTWGGGYRMIDNAAISAPTAPAYLNPERREITLANVFVQDQIALRPNLVATLGAKLEENSFSGTEFLPNARLAWTRENGDLVWGAVSRASRAPSRIDRDFEAPNPGGPGFFIVPSQFESEILTAYELGYRAAPAANMTYSVNLFFHDYDGLRTVGFVNPGVFPVTFRNDGEGETWGVEAWGAFEVNPRWRLNAGVMAMDRDFRVTPGAVDITGIASAGNDPQYQVLLGSHAELSDRLELDINVRAVGELPQTLVDHYIVADVRLGWLVAGNTRLELIGRNLFGGRRLEAHDPNRQREFGSSVQAGLRVGF